MEFIAHRLKQLQITLNITLPLYLRFMLGVSIGVAILVLAMTALTRFAQSPSNPFSAYTDILPGQPRSALVMRGFSCSYEHEITIEPFQSPISQFCRLRPETGVFDLIGVILDDNVIKQVTFSLRDHSLTVGDLAQWWGKPELFSPRAAWIGFSWPDMSVTAYTQSVNRKFSYFSPLTHVFIGDLN